MAKKRKTDVTTKTEERQTGEAQSFILPQRHVRALNAFLESQRPAPSKASVFRIGLEMFLETKGFWPPPDQE
jgi:hypothetical protein